MIWLEYEYTEDESEWITVFRLIYAVSLVFNFYIAYPAKPGPLPLSWFMLLYLSSTSMHF